MSFGVYIHIPFCRSKCNYCSFISRPWDEPLAEKYWRAVVQELKAFFSSNPTSDIADSIFFGGGTPSLVPADHIAEILASCRELFEVSANCEITLEANPGTLSSKKAEKYLAMGVNRISMGAQTFSDQELVAIGRIHTSDEVAESMALLRSTGFENINLDLILGLPGQSQEQWQANLKQLVELAPAHVSVYMLELDPKAPLYHSVAKGLARVPDDDSMADWYLQTLDYFSNHRYRQYEISNFARPEFECRHNLKYWQREPVLGFGVGSHSFDGCTRYANHPKLETYLKSLEEGQSPIDWRQAVSDEEGLQETLFLGLRLSQGLDWEKIRTEFGTADLVRIESSLDSMCAEGLLEWKDSSIHLTRRGMLLSNEVFQEFV